MRKLMILVVGLVGGLTIVAWTAAPATGGPAKTLTRTTSTSSASGNYSVLMTFHDPVTGQEGNGAGTLIFNASGVLSGVLSENSRCNMCSGNDVNIRAQVVPPSNYIVYPDASATLDVCLRITNAATTQGGTPGPVSQYVEFIWEGAFSASFFHGRFIQTLLNPTPSMTSCDRSVPWVQTPNVTSGDLEKV
jgi:hypothetical protein